MWASLRFKRKIEKIRLLKDWKGDMHLEEKKDMNNKKVLLFNQLVFV